MLTWWILIGLAVFLIGVTKSGFGGGVGLTIVPMTAIAMDHIPDRGSEAALGLMLPLLIVGDIIALWQYRRLYSFDSVRRLVPGTAFGVVVGGSLLWAFHQLTHLVGAVILIIIGLESVSLVILHWRLSRRGENVQLLREPLRSHLTGLYAGVSSTLAHAAGPIITMYLLPLRLDRRLFVGTNAVFFFLLNTTKFPAYYLSHQFEKAELSFSLRFLPLVLAGALFGLWINRRMSDRIFSGAVYVLTFCLGWYLLADGILKLAANLKG